METATITLNDFQAFALSRLSEGIKHPAQLFDKVKEVFDYAVANGAAMDSEASAYFDRLIDGFADIMQEQADKVADGRDKRNMLRAIAVVKGKHFSAKGFLNGLGKPLVGKFPVVEAARPVFLATVQSILDVLFDATRESHQGPASLAMLAMVGWAVDELNAGFYLAQQKYATQAYNHIRTVFELLDKVELFLTEPKWIEIWGGTDKKKILNELSPGAVRQKLGRARYDAAYSFLSELGSHGTFEAVRRRILKRGNQEGRPQISFWIGGVAWDTEVVASVCWCIFGAMSTLMMAITAFKERLNEDDAVQTLKDRSVEAVAFLREHFVHWAEESGHDASEIAAMLNSISAI